MRVVRNLITIALILCACTQVEAQEAPNLYGYARPSLSWHTLKGEHFEVIYHLDQAGVGPDTTAAYVLEVAEAAWEPITALYGFVPDTPVAIVITDYLDYANGAAFFFDNYIEIWVPALSSSLRADHRWIENVVTHEFTHIVQVQASMKRSRRWPATYIQYLDYDNARRPDVLYGYPNVIATIPHLNLNNPAWLAEGTAQFQREQWGFDRWDDRRDMLLRRQMVAPDPFSIADIGGFYSHTSMGRESVYNIGFALSRFIAAEFGEKGLSTLTEALSTRGTLNVERAWFDAFGEPAHQTFTRFRESLVRHYTDHMSAPAKDGGDLISEGGFFNHAPRFSPDGEKVAFLTNDGEDYSTLSLVVYDLDSAEEVALALDVPPSGQHTASLSTATVRGVESSFDWSTDGSGIYLVQQKDTPEGDRFRDLFFWDLNAKKPRRLTSGIRVGHVRSHPTEASLTISRSVDSQPSIWQVDHSGEHLLKLFDLDPFQTVRDLEWSLNGDTLFVLAGPDSPELISWSDGSLTTTEKPGWTSFAVHPQTHALIAASTLSGISNLVQDDATWLTDVNFGAFDPHIAPDGSIVASVFGEDGFTIKHYQSPSPVGTVRPYQSISWLQRSYNSAEESGRVLPADRLTRAVDRLENSEPYQGAYTRFSLFPLIRFDQYVERETRRMQGVVAQRGAVETLWRNTKVGSYFASREIIPGVDFSGGVVLGPGSARAKGLPDALAPNELLSLERDVFLSVDYRKGFGIIPKRYSPQLSLKAFHIRRNVEDGIAIEEYRCTACYPDTTTIDLSYNLWEFDVGLRFKPVSNTLLSGGFVFSPYRANTERFYSVEYDQGIPGNSNRYYAGRRLYAGIRSDVFKSHRHSDVLRHGFMTDLSLTFERGQLLDRFAVEDGYLTPKYADQRHMRIAWSGLASFAFGRGSGSAVHGPSLKWYASAISDQEAPTFFDEYVAGLSFARGYPFYALGGPQVAWLQGSYTFPILPHVGVQLGSVYLDKVYARIYADRAMVQRVDRSFLAAHDVGVELRAVTGMYYLFPSAFFLSATYGVDRFTYTLDPSFVQAGERGTIRYGKDLLWHAGIVFELDP